jgi:CheY-like chemotaxis protein
MAAIPTILLVEDNPDDADLALLAFQESQLANEIVVAHDGVEAPISLAAAITRIGTCPSCRN